MAYTYEVRFPVPLDRMGELAVGASVERTIGFLKTLLPGEPGYMTARAMHSMPDPETSETAVVVVQSVWERWDDLQRHISTGLAEKKILAEFARQIDPDKLQATIYEEIP